MKFSDRTYLVEIETEYAAPREGDDEYVEVWSGEMLIGELRAAGLAGVPAPGKRIRLPTNSGGGVCVSACILTILGVV